MEPNALAITLIVLLLLMWNLDLVASLLNLKAFSPQVPEEFRDQVSVHEHRKSQAYLVANVRFHIFSSAVGLFALFSFWFLGGFGWLDSLCRTWAGDGVGSGLLFISLLYLGNMAIHLPLDIYDTFVLEERFGFNRTTRATFVADRLKSLLLAAVIGLPLLAAVLGIFRTVPHAWLWAWLLFTAIQLLLLWLAPVVILPLFNKFTPMPEGETRTAIESMAASCGFPLTEISIMDGSKRSSKANAYFTGFGKHKKIALYDTLVEEQTTGELVAVLAHEIGHYKCRHILQRLAMAILQSAVLFFLLGLVIGDNAFSHQLFRAFGVAQLSPHVGIVLFAILFSPVSRVVGIFSNAWSRHHEFQADAFAARATRHPEELISALKKLSATNLTHLTPHALRVFLDHSHPPVLERIRALRRCAI